MVTGCLAVIRVVRVVRVIRLMKLRLVHDAIVCKLSVVKLQEGHGVVGV